MSILLAIETSQRIGGVALRDAAGVVRVEMLSVKKRHDDDLLPAIDRLFAKSKLSPRDLRSESAGGRSGAVGVSIGPGGFTGLRIAISTAKMFAETLGTPLVGVPSALVAAESGLMNAGESVDPNANSATSSGKSIVVALAAKGDSFWSTHLTHDGNHWRIMGTPGLRDATSQDLGGVGFMLADTHLPEPMRLRCEQIGVSVIEPTFDPCACLSVAQRELEEGALSDPLVLSPLYPREPEAVSLWNRKSAGSRDER
jgi:tRNA threonylcarbamoyl adenosine modification protein YeaZ